MNNRFYWVASLFFLVATLISGCSSISGFPKSPTVSTATSPNPGYQLGDDAIRKYNEETSLSQKKFIRNEIIDARMAEIDKKFSDFERDLYSEGVGAGIGTDWAVLGLTAASTLSTVNSVKTIYSAVSTAVVGGQAAYDKRALFDKTLPALLAQMVAERESIRASIRTSQQLPVDSYSWFAAESDLQKFLFAGSIPGAIAAVSQDAGQKIASAKLDLKVLSQAIYGNTETSKLIISFWKPDGKSVNSANESAINAWLTTNGFSSAPGQIPMFAYDSSLEQSRIKAVKDLGLPK